MALLKEVCYGEWLAGRLFGDKAYQWTYPALDPTCHIQYLTTRQDVPTGAINDKTVYGDNHDSLEWIQDLLHRIRFMPGTVNMIQTHSLVHCRS